MQHHFERVPYITNEKGEIIFTDENFDLLIEYMVRMEGALNSFTGQTFGDIPETLKKGFIRKN